MGVSPEVTAPQPTPWRSKTSLSVVRRPRAFPSKRRAGSPWFARSSPSSARSAVLTSFFEEVYEVFRTDRGWDCYPETEGVLGTLQQHEYQLGVVSNFDSRRHGVLRDLGIRDYFDAVVTPDSAGYAKPGSRIFLEATSALGVAPGEALFAGDDIGQDFEAAARSGAFEPPDLPRSHKAARGPQYRCRPRRNPPLSGHWGRFGEQKSLKCLCYNNLHSPQNLRGAQRLPGFW